MRRSALLIIAIALIGREADAHVDSILHLSDDGSIFELPTEYQPANLIVNLPSVIELRLGKRRNILPICLIKLVGAQHTEDIRIKGSWYHDKSIMPYYVDITFFDSSRGSTEQERPGYAFLFNLHTAKIIEIKRLDVVAVDHSIEETPVDPHTVCTKTEVYKAFGAWYPSLR